MQFRIKTLLVIVTILVFALAFSSYSSPSRRVWFLVTVAAVWISGGLTAQSLRTIGHPIRLHRFLLVLGSIVLTSLALSSAVLWMGLILYDRFQPAMTSH